VTVTTPTQGTVCNPNAKASRRTSVQNLKCLAVAVSEIFILFIISVVHEVQKKIERKTEGQNRQNISKYTDNG